MSYLLALVDRTLVPNLYTKLFVTNALRSKPRKAAVCAVCNV